MNFKNLSKVSDTKKSVLDSEILRVKKALGKISDAASDKYKVLDAQYKALIRKKIRDTKQHVADADLSAVKEKMLEDLKNNLQAGKVYFATGADVPGESVLYVSKDQLISALNKYSKELSVPEFEGVASEEELRTILANLGVENSLKDPFYKAAYVEDTGEFKLLSGSNVEDLAPEISFYAQLYLEGDPDLGEIRFQDDNDETGNFEFKTL